MDADYVLLLSQEHPALPRAEAEAVLTAENVSFTVTDEESSLIFLDVDTENEGDGVGASGITTDMVNRLAMSFEVGELLYTFEPDSYQKLAARPPSTDQSFAVRKLPVDDTTAPDELEENVGRIIDKASEGHVDLDSPNVLYRIYLSDDTAYLCRTVTEIDRSQYEQRKNQYRPYSSPVSMHPRLARALVNLSQVPRDGALLDPFCGTGGTLIEAGLIGCDVYGLDLQEEMVNGAQENLASFNLNGDIRQGSFDDITTVFEDEIPFDAVVTDLPYGKASKVQGDPTASFVETAPELTDGTTVFMTDKASVNGLEPRFELYVHRSMSRYVYVLD